MNPPAQADSPKESWQLAINETRGNATVVFTDGSRDESGRVGAGWYVEGGLAQGHLGLGKCATVWDGEVAGMRKGLEAVDRRKKVLILSDSQAAIAAVKRAGRTGKARTRDLRKLVREIKRRQEILGSEAVRFGWVKAHVNIFGNEKQTSKPRWEHKTNIPPSRTSQKVASDKSGKREERRKGKPRGRWLDGTGRQG